MRTIELTEFTPTERALLDINEKLRTEIAALKRKAADDESENDTKAPKPGDAGDDDTSTDDDAEIDENGKLRPKKKKPKASDDTIPQDEEDEPNANAWNKLPSRAKALCIINAGLAARGQKPLGRLAQDQEILPGGVVPTDPEQFARAVVNAARKARAQSPLKPGEFISIKEMRG
jgi:predicted component of type VI protein secretion system